MGIPRLSETRLPLYLGTGRTCIHVTMKPSQSPIEAHSPNFQTTLAAARDARNDEMVRALEPARAKLGEHLVRMGVRAPEPRKRPAKGEAM